MTPPTDEAQQHSETNPAEPECDSTSKEHAAYGVRESREQASSTIPHQARPSPAAHRSTRLLIQLSSEWRVVDDDLQFLLERRRGDARSKASGWVGQSFCRRRDALLRCIREKCGHVDGGALKQVEALPEWREGTG
jgi:hypothetical protein